jgi:hypothetical protein
LRLALSAFNESLYLSRFPSLCRHSLLLVKVSSLVQSVCSLIKALHSISSILCSWLIDIRLESALSLVPFLLILLGSLNLLLIILSLGSSSIEVQASIPSLSVLACSGGIVKSLGLESAAIYFLLFNLPLLALNPFLVIFGNGLC